MIVSALVRVTRGPWRGAGLILLYNALFALFLALKPGSPALVRAVDDLANLIGPLLAVVCCARSWWPKRRSHSESATSGLYRWAPLLLALGAVSFSAGQGVWAYNELILKHLCPFPSWADAGYLAVYPVVLLGILLLPARRLSPAARLRLLVDGLMTMVAVATFSWYVILGPAVLQARETVFAKSVAAAYPVGDVVLVLCLLLLWVRLADPALRRVVAVLSLGVGVLAVGNAVYDYQLLHGTYITGELVDPCWALGYMMIGLGAAALRRTIVRQRVVDASGDAQAAAPASGVTPAWWSLLPYLLIPGVGGLLAYALRVPDHSHRGLDGGVYVGAALLVILVLVRQILMVLENGYLYRRLNAAYTEQGADLARRVTELEWLREISQRLTAARTLDDVLDVVYDGIRDGLGYDRVGIQLFDHAQGTFEERRGTDEQGRKMRPTGRMMSLAPDSPTWRFPDIAALLRGAEYYYTADAYAETPPDLRHLLDGTPTHNLSVSLRSGTALIGMIAVDNLLSGRPIAPQDAGPLLALAHHVGTAIENGHLHEREQAERAHLEVLVQSAHALNSTLDNQHILQALVQHLVTALDATNAAFTRVDLGARICRSLVNYAVPGSVPLFSDDPWERLDDYPELEAVLRTQTPFIGHVDDPDFPANEREYLRRHALESELMVPLIIRDQASGVLEIHWDRWVDISPDMLELCTAIAGQAAVALENARLYAEAADRAQRDALTGLLNHRALLAHLDQALTASPATPCALLLIDVDNFKLFNDTYGHAVGDAALLRVAETLRAACRAGDAAGRYGGDEFALVLQGASAEEAQAVARRISATVQEQPHVTEAGTVIPLAVSVGVAAAPGEGQTRPELVALADAAMYAAKRGARGRTPRSMGPGGPHVQAHARDAADLLGDSPFGVLEGLVTAVDAKDRYTREHSEHVTELALLLAEAVGLEPEQRRVLALAGPLHDVGKIAVPDRVLRKPGPLAADEYETLKRHVAYGVAIVRGVLNDEAVVEAIAYHHERWDGRGYPYALAGPATPLSGRIMQVADAVSAMLLDRPYRKGLAWTQVVAELRKGADKQFDPALVEPFIAAAERLRWPAAS